MEYRFANMQEIKLSDHAADQLYAAARQREAAMEQSLARYKSALAAREQKSDALRGQAARAAGEKRLFAWLWHLARWAFHAAFAAKPTRPMLALPDEREHVWAAGSEGEQRVADILNQALPADWTLIRGYKNGGGEIDQIIVSPLGVLAVEIKYINGTVFCDGDRWWRDKYDRYGNLVEQGIAIADKGGRSPSEQLNAATDRLQNFLSSRMQVKRVARAVVLAHQASRIGQMHNLTVDLVATLAHLYSRELIEQKMPGLPAGVSPQRVIEAIQKDHAYQQNGRSGRGQANKATPKARAGV
jgi:hypothetical protein